MYASGTSIEVSQSCDSTPALVGPACVEWRYCVSSDLNPNPGRPRGPTGFQLIAELTLLSRHIHDFVQVDTTPSTHLPPSFTSARSSYFVSLNFVNVSL